MREYFSRLGCPRESRRTDWRDANLEAIQKVTREMQGDSSDTVSGDADVAYRVGFQRTLEIVLAP